MRKIAVGGLFLGMIASGVEVIDAAYIIKTQKRERIYHCSILAGG